MIDEKKIKCIVWDLDNTIWNGTLVEDNDVKLNQNAYKVILELDKRGILHSIASKNDYDLAFKKLQEFGIDKYFIYPEILVTVVSNHSIQRVAETDHGRTKRPSTLVHDFHLQTAGRWNSTCGNRP